MSLLLVDSFDHYVEADMFPLLAVGTKKWQQALGADPVITAGQGRNGTACARLDAWRGDSFYHDVSPVLATGVIGFAFRFSALPVSESEVVIFGESGVASHVTISISAGGILNARRGDLSTGVVLGSSAGALSINTYYYIEVKVTVDDAAGVVHVKVDQSSVINLTAQDTRNGGSASFNYIQFGSGTAGGDAANIDIDDFYFLDTNGSLNNDFLGDCRVVALLPDGNGATNDWTPSAGSNFQNVDDNPPNEHTDYNSEGSANGIDLFTYPTTGSLGLIVKGVAVWPYIYNESFATPTLRPVSRPGSTNYFGTTTTTSGDTQYHYHGSIFETNGDTGLPWVESEIDAAQFGVQAVSGGGNIIRCTQLPIEVLFSALPVGNRVTQYVVEAITQPSAAAGLPLIRATQYIVEAVLSTSTEVTPGTPCAPTSSIQQTYPPCYGAEFDTYIAPDGHTYDFHVKGLRHLMTEEGFGMPPISYLTSVGPYQHGQTVHDWFLEPRIIQLMISNSSNSRQAYTAARAALLDAIRPNRQVNDNEREPGVLRKRLSDGSLRDLKVLIESGPGFGPRDLARWDEYRFQEILRFIAHDPILFNPLQQCRSFLAIAGSPGSGGGTQLVFPCTFPIVFGIGTGSGGGGGGLSGVLQYNGTWEEYPQIIIHGPVTSPVITNVTTGERLALEDEILEGETVTFDLTYATKTVTHSDGSNWLGRLSNDSDLATFHLSTINSGANIIVITGSGTNAAMFVEFFYYERFIGR